jgi:aspartate 1-decarboxylase
MNGPAARKALKGDIVIVISYAQMEYEKAKSFVPRIVFPDANNKI